jgi:uncharacterized CHY-type Zn-finger protein
MEHNNYKHKESDIKIINKQDRNIYNNIMNTSSNKINNIVIDRVTSAEENIKHEINKVKEGNEKVERVVTKAITTASALIKYLTLHHQSTPPLRKIKQKECIKFLRIDYNCPQEKDNYDLEKNFVKDFSRKLFVKNICKSILNMVNYKKPDMQPIWNTDSSRFNYVIKTAIDKWDEDKAGVKFTEYVIKPVLDYVLDLIHSYRTDFLAKELCNKKYTKNQLMDIMQLTGLACDLQTELNNQTFIKPMLKELTPYLRFLEYELEEIEQEEQDEIEEQVKLEELEKIKDDLENLITNKNHNNNVEDSEENSYKSDNDENSDEKSYSNKKNYKININKLKKRKQICE